MTNREKLKEVFPYTIFIYRKEDDKTNAIMCTDEWLDSEYIAPTTKNDLGVDCISREQALVAIRNLYPSMPRVDFNGSLRKWVDKYKPYIECDDAIKQLPSVTPQEPRKGHWIYDNFNWRCSECNETPKTMGYVGTADFMTEHFKFCNHCGARMIEPQESEVEDGNVD